MALPDDAPPVAVIAGNDRAAVGVYRGAHLRGWNIPGDVAVTGWNNDEVGGYLNPPLTTVNVERVEAGRWEMRRLLAAIKQEPEPNPPAALNTIVWRESTGLPSTR
jgi:DNA-binding LacI/PurR family transcriptional regulator